MALTDEVDSIPNLDWHDHHKAQHRLRHIPCGRCNGVIEHDRRAPWYVVNKLVNKHWEVCPGRPYGIQRPGRMSRAPTSPPGTAIGLPILPALSQPNSPKPANEHAGSSKHTWVTSEWERKRKTENQRKLELEEDEYTMKVTATSVICVGCQMQISLDKRSRYYPGLWLKHKSKCPDIEKLERSRAGIQLPVGNTVQASHKVTGNYPVLTDSRIGYGDDGYQTDTTQASVHDISGASGDHYWSDVSSDDEDDTESLHIPFPTLNRAYYWTYRSDEWIYRYATNEEVATNLFRDGSGK